MTVDLSGDGWYLWLDEQASWIQDVLELPGVDLARLPVRPPTGGWDLLRDALAVRVPGTVEGLLWDERGDYVGVSWWWRRFEPPPLRQGQRARLRFESARLRAEVFVNCRLVGYDAVGNTPFEVDVTEALRPGVNMLAVRITDPGGRLDGKDHGVDTWGAQPIPPSPGFGGLTGPVTLLITDPVRVADVFVRNTPAVTEAIVSATLVNESRRAVEVPVTVQILDAAGRTVARFDAGRHRLPAGPTVVERTVTLPGAIPWSMESPVLYRCRVALAGGDAHDVRFGFRWFSPEGQEEEDAVLRLNGRRVVLRSALASGLWPVTGLAPPAGLARRQVEVARELGLNMLTHRIVAAPGVLDLHDELGLLAWLEPGGLACPGGDELTFRLAREKWLRMVRRDRNHPSVVILSMVREARQEPGEHTLRSLADARQLDPSLTITYTSAWGEDQPPAFRLHLRPDDPRPHLDGWLDQHHGAGPGVWRDGFWRGPHDHRRRSTRRDAIVLWGEDGASGGPGSLGAGMAGRAPLDLGWEGSPDRALWQAGQDFLRDKGLTAALPDLGTLLTGLASVAYDYHARMLENVRLGDVADGYVIDAFESMRRGLVDAWRHPKGPPARLSSAAAPLVLAVKLRGRVRGVDPGGGQVPLCFDVGIVNEADLRGPHELRLVLVAEPDGQAVEERRLEVELSGGDCFGQMLAVEQLWTPTLGPGRYRLAATLEAPTGGTLVTGGDDLLLVDAGGPPISGSGALVDGSGLITRFLQDAGVPAFDPALGPLDWIVVADVDPIRSERVPAEVLGLPDGSGPGLRARYTQGLDEGAPVVAERDEATPDVAFGGQASVPGLAGGPCRIQWTGWLTPPESGDYRFSVVSNGGARLWVADRLLLDAWAEGPLRREDGSSVRLEEGRAVPLRLEAFDEDPEGRVRLLWTRPSRHEKVLALAAELERRVAEHGTTLLVLDAAQGWARLLADRGALAFRGRLPLGRHELQGGYVLARHPLLDGLPAGGALGWEYQGLLDADAPAGGLLLEGEEVVVACLGEQQLALGTSLGIVTHGAGRILLSCFDLPSALPQEEPGPRDVVGRLVRNALAWAARRP